MLNSRKAIIVAAAAAALFVGCDKKAAVKLESDQQKAGYAIGRDIGERMKSQNVEVDVAALAAGLEEGLAGKEARLKPEEMQAAMQKLQEATMKKMMEQAEKNKTDGTEFLAKNKEKSGVKATDSGLQYEVVEEGKGTSPKASDTVKVHYTGTLVNGEKFDSSVDRGQPAEFPVNGVIPGWTEALQLMKPGAKWKLTIPPDLAYGPQGRPGIPPNSVLLFDVELIEVVKK